MTEKKNSKYSNRNQDFILEKWLTQLFYRPNTFNDEDDEQTN